jgi:hypothetical protein
VTTVVGSDHSHPSEWIESQADVDSSSQIRLVNLPQQIK